MVSLKQHIDNWHDTPSLDPALATCGALLLSFAGNCHRAVPDLGKELETKLLELRAAIPECTTQEAIVHIQSKAADEISLWADKASAHHADTRRELQDIIGVIGRAIETVSERDQRYALEVGKLAECLRAVTTLNDVSVLRRSISESAQALTHCVERVARASSESLQRLSAQVEEYRARLDKSEQLSSVDPLTGLANRRRFEEQLKIRMDAGGAFCLILIDLDNFKCVNDHYGHLAGDELLTGFAAELRRQFRLADLVARWGGDEFAVIVNSAQNDVQAGLNGIRRRIVREYSIHAGSRTVALPIHASIGVAQWDLHESAMNLLARADRSMYASKKPASASHARA